MQPHHPQRRGTALNLPGFSQESSTSKPQQGDPSAKLIIVMVGLPARGKSFITNKLTRYLNWQQLECRVFNVGNTRRLESENETEVQALGPSKQPLPDTERSKSTTTHDANFFDPRNTESFNRREKWAMDTLDQLLDFLLLDNGSIGIFDATNSTKARRQKIFNKIRERNDVIKVLYLESICTDEAIIQKNIRLKLNGPDYINMDPESALKDFTDRLKNYESAYQTIEDSENLQYIKMIDVGKKIITYNIQGFLPSQTVYYLLNFNLQDRQIWITRNGESQDNLIGKIGGDSSLTQKGERFSIALEKFISESRKSFIESHPTASEFYNVWTSCLSRSMQTSKPFHYDPSYTIKTLKILNDLSCGDFEGLTYPEFQNLHPHEFQSRLDDKLNYRYPGPSGESYMDVINRVRQLIIEVERTTENLVIVSHRVVIRILLGYFLNLDKEMITSLNVPLNHVFLLEPKPFGVEWSLFKYVDDQDTFVKLQDDEFLKVKEQEIEFNKRRYSVVPMISRPSSSQANPNPFFNARLPGERTPSTGSSTSSLNKSSPNSLFNPRLKDPLLSSINKDRNPAGMKPRQGGSFNNFNSASFSGRSPNGPQHINASSTASRERYPNSSGSMSRSPSDVRSIKGAVKTAGSDCAVFDDSEADEMAENDSSVDPMTEIKHRVEKAGF